MPVTVKPIPLNTTKSVVREGVHLMNWYATSEEAIAAAQLGSLGLDRIIVKRSNKYSWIYVPMGCFEFAARLVEMLGCTYESSVLILNIPS